LQIIYSNNRWLCNNLCNITSLILRCEGTMKYGQITWIIHYISKVINFKINSIDGLNGKTGHRLCLFFYLIPNQFDKVKVVKNNFTSLNAKTFYLHFVSIKTFFYSIKFFFLHLPLTVIYKNCQKFATLILLGRSPLGRV